MSCEDPFQMYWGNSENTDSITRRMSVAMPIMGQNMAGVGQPHEGKAEQQDCPDKLLEYHPKGHNTFLVDCKLVS